MLIPAEPDSHRPYEAYERLTVWVTAKTQNEARFAPSETDQPRFSLRKSTTSVFLRKKLTFARQRLTNEYNPFQLA